MKMDNFNMQKIIHYADRELLYLPEHTDFALFSLGTLQRNNENLLRLSVEVQSTINTKNSKVDFLFSKRELLPVHVAIGNFLLTADDIPATGIQYKPDDINYKR